MVLSAQPPTGDDLAMYNFTGLRTSDNVTNEPFWIRGYDLVQAANKVFNLLTDELVAANGNVKLKEYQGRAYLTRAYGYLFLMENYGTDELGVPIYTRYTLAQEVQARASAPRHSIPLSFGRKKPYHCSKRPGSDTLKTLTAI